jgi:hypothetical protein
MTAIAGRTEAKGDMNYFRYVVLNSLRLLNAKFKPQYGKMLIAMDSHTPSWRKQTFPYYKAKRKVEQDKSAIDWAELKQFVKQMCLEVQGLHWQTMLVDGAEADDIIAVVAKMIVPHEKVVIVSKDKDFIQLQIRMEDQISQWDSRQERLLKVDNPGKQLFELICKGDAADGIPNIFSPDDHYVAPAGRAKPVTQKKLDEWWETGISDLAKLPGFKRNMQLIDFNRIPKSVQDQIGKAFSNYQATPKQSLMDYMADNQLGNLYKHIGDF